MSAHRCPCPVGCEVGDSLGPVASEVEPTSVARGGGLEITAPTVVCRGAVVERDAETGAVLDLHVRGGVLLPAPDVVRFEAVLPSATAPITSASADAPLRAELLGRHARSRRRRLVQASLPSLEARVIRVLSDLATRVGIPDTDGVLLPLPLTRRTVAELVGCREESLVRLISRWEAEGVLEWGREGLRLRDQARFAPAVRAAG